MRLYALMGKSIIQTYLYGRPHASQRRIVVLVNSKQMGTIYKDGHEQFNNTHIIVH